MDNAQILASKLNECIKNEDLYKEYLEKKNILMNDKLDYEKYENFMKLHLDYQLRLNNGEKPDFASDRGISSLYSDMILIKSIKDYIEVRQRLMDVMQELMDAAFADVENEIF